MNPLIQLKQRTSLFLAAFGLACFGLLPVAQAVSPAPDGGYAGGNTAEGGNALFSLTTGGFNTAVGFLSLSANTTNSFNTAVGAGALLATTGEGNTATGAGALLSDTTGSTNTANGAFALFSNTTGSDNTAVGRRALQNNTGSSNTAVGRDSLFNTTTGNNNVALGKGAGATQTTGSNNVYIGEGMGGVAGESNACYIASIFGQTIDPATGVPAGVDTNGKLGTVLSARRFKHDIQPIDNASEAILALKPVTFHYKSDAKNTPCFGLIAEDVAAVSPDLVVRDKNGELTTVRYDQINAMLLNEFLKEHSKVQEQEAAITELKSTVAQQQKGMGVLAATLKEQASQIQKVSAQIELSKSAPQAVLNNQ